MRSVLPVFKSVGSAWIDFHIAAAHGRFASRLCHVAQLPIVREKFKEAIMPVLLWLLGVPTVVIVLLYVLNVI